MWNPPDNDAFVEELYLAGERVASGTYKQVGGDREIRVDTEDVLPASLDGRVACYVRVQYTWALVSARVMTADSLPSSDGARTASRAQG